MDKTLIIKNEGARVKVKLKRDGGLLGEVDFPLDIHFDTVLVTSIDKILKENRIDRVSPLDVLLEGFDDEASMSYLIARTVAGALKIK
jgi:hypothetical protein